MTNNSEETFDVNRRICQYRRALTAVGATTMKGQTKAVSYVRVSGKGQVDGDGPERQRQAIVRFAKGAGLHLLDEFSDLGVSGTTELADRPGLAALIDRLESNGVRTVVVERADRLARDLMVQEVIVGQFSKIGARILTADGVDLTSSDDPTRRLIRQVLGAVAEFEKNVVVLKLRAARERKRARGERVEGVKPYGYFPAEQAVLDRMRQLRRKPAKGHRLSVASVAAQLNAEGHRNRSGRDWSAQMVHHVLKSA
jgi:DNA invertase Pin-like site-specific DNA recombinase